MFNTIIRIHYQHSSVPFSYLFIIFSLFLLLFLFGFIMTGGLKRIEFNFSNQLQVSIIAIIIVSFIVLGLITRSNVISLYNNKNKDNLSEKTFSVLTELEHKLGNEADLTGEMADYVTEYLNKFSAVFFTDINGFIINIYSKQVGKSFLFQIAKCLSKAAPNIENGQVFTKKEKVTWRCRNCGYLHEGESAPEMCAACAHPKAHFEVLGENW